MFARKAVGGILDWDGSYTQIRCHSGRTDTDFGHNDYRNASGLGSYHWHHGEGPHLHPDKVQGESLIDLLKSYSASVYTATKSSSGNTTYIFESIIELEINKKYFTLEITGKEDGFYLIGDGEKILVENFWGTELSPVYITRNNSPWNGALGGLDYLVNAEYFKVLVKKHCGLEGPWNAFKYDWKGEHITAEFLNKVVDISGKLSINPDDLMAIMVFESGLNPAYKNPNSSASGLIGFMDDTATGLNTTTEKLRSMSAVEQLDYVYKYYEWKAGKMESLGDIYMATLWPKGIGESNDYILFSKGSNQYKWNDYLDINGDGDITKGEAEQRVIQEREKWLNK